jgi:hypothetical protein
MKKSSNRKPKNKLDNIDKDLWDKMRAAANAIQLDSDSFEEYIKLPRLPKKN